MSKIFILLILFGFLFILLWFYDYNDEKFDIESNTESLDNFTYEDDLKSFDSEVLFKPDFQESIITHNLFESEDEEYDI